MTIDIKLYFINQIQLTPDEIKFIESINLPIDYKKIIVSNNLQLLAELFSDVIDENNLIEEEILQLAYINTKIKRLSIKFSTNIDEEFYEYDDSFYEEDSDTQEYHNELEYDWKERRKIQKEAISKYKQYSQKEIDNLLFEYVWNNYPQIRKGFDRSVYSKAKLTFISNIGIFAKFDAPEPLRVKLENAEENAKVLLIDKFKQLEIDKFDEWFSEYKRWLTESNLSKSTKTIIKEFFKELGIKVSDKTIEKIKALY